MDVIYKGLDTFNFVYMPRGMRSDLWLTQVSLHDFDIIKMHCLDRVM